MNPKKTTLTTHGFPTRYGTWRTKPDSFVLGKLRRCEAAPTQVPQGGSTLVPGGAGNSVPISLRRPQGLQVSFPSKEPSLLPRCRRRREASGKHTIINSECACKTITIIYVPPAPAIPPRASRLHGYDSPLCSELPRTKV